MNYNLKNCNNVLCCRHGFAPFISSEKRNFSNRVVVIEKIKIVKRLDCSRWVELHHTMLQRTFRQSRPNTSRHHFHGKKFSFKDAP